jgi:hypothetical protein
LPIDLPLLSKIGALVGLPVAGAIASHLWSRYRRRLAGIRWSAEYQPFAFATDDFGWGKVEILYDGQPTKNLHVINMALQNASSHDLQDVRLDLVMDSGTHVLRSAGAVRGSLQPLPFAPDYAHILTDAGKRVLTSVELDYWAGRSPFLIPVLNRRAVADIRLLVSREDHSTPQVTVGCDNKGVRLTHQPFVLEHLGVRQGQAQVVGVILTLAILSFAVFSGWSGWKLGALAWISGAFAMSIGALAIRTWRALVRMAD